MTGTVNKCNLQLYKYGCIRNVYYDLKLQINKMCIYMAYIFFASSKQNQSDTFLSLKRDHIYWVGVSQRSKFHICS